MRRTLKRVLSPFLITATRWYLRKERKHRFRGIEVTVLPGVFHPGLFSSTHFLIRHLENYDLAGKQLLELGSGTGLISIWASTKGAVVTACDLSVRAVINTTSNANRLNSKISIIESDLFDKISKRVFDWIVINPPFYARSVSNEEQLAWHCGEHFEYFEKLFETLAGYINDDSQVVMILTQEGCDVETVHNIAKKHSFYFDLLKERRALLDGRDFLFRIRRSLSAGTAVPF